MEALAGVAVTAGGTLIGGPAGGLVASAAIPFISAYFKKIGTEVINETFGERSEIRFGYTYAIALQKINEKIEAGVAIRDDEFFNINFGDKTNAETILEGTLLKVKNEYEEKKLKYYSNFIANLNFDYTTDFDESITLLRIIERLNYRQLTIVAVINNEVELRTHRWNVNFPKYKELNSFQDFYSDLMDLYNMNLLSQNVSKKKGISMGIEEMILTPIGEKLFSLMELNEIDQTEIDAIKATIENIKEIISEKEK